MLETPAEEIATSQDKTNFLELITQKQTINILVYADGMIKDNESDFGITRMRQLIDSHQPASAAIHVDLRDRLQPDSSGNQVRLPEILKEKPYSQIWFFGYQQLTKEEKNDPHNPTEYSEDELMKLTGWMKEGGVLIAGDHSEPDPRTTQIGADSCAEGIDHETFLTLGRALGEKVPRAGQLRTWKGPPTSCVNDSHSTLVRIFGPPIQTLNLDRDKIPQLLILKAFDPVTGKPTRVGRPHQIFEDRKGDVIRVFPDHLHEGEVVLPTGAELEKWLKDNVVAPYTVAYGIDKRDGNKYDLLALYNGDRGGVGRIAADSTWHHYLNDNLKEFKEGVAGANSVIDEIGQFYSNLAVWLAPYKVRQAMAFYTFYKLANNPQVLEEISSDILNIGRTAHRILSAEAAPCEIHELLQMTIPGELRQKYENLYFATSGSTATPLPSQELILGAVVRLYYQSVPGIINSALSESYKVKRLAEITREAFKQARETHVQQLTKISALAQSFV